MHKRLRGFTIVELLIVIAVVAILAIIVTISYRGLQTRAQASAYGSEIKAMAKSIMTYKDANALSPWPLDTSTVWNSTAAGNPSITSIIAANSDFRGYAQKEIQQKGLTNNASDSWFLDNDGDTYVPCANTTMGVNLVLASPTNTALMQAIDSAIDDGNLSCGKFHYSAPYLVYVLSETQY